MLYKSVIYKEGSYKSKIYKEEYAELVILSPHRYISIILIDFFFKKNEKTFINLQKDFLTGTAHDCPPLP